MRPRMDFRLWTSGSGGANCLRRILSDIINLGLNIIFPPHQIGVDIQRQHSWIRADAVEPSQNWTGHGRAFAVRAINDQWLSWVLLISQINPFILLSVLGQNVEAHVSVWVDVSLAEPSVNAPRWFTRRLILYTTSQTHTSRKPHQIATRSFRFIQALYNFLKVSKNPQYTKVFNSIIENTHLNILNY